MNAKAEMIEILRGFGIKQVLWTVILTLVLVFLFYYQSQRSVIDQTSVELTSNRFSQAVAEVHLQWLKEGKPKQLNWNGKLVFLSDEGWPVSLNDKNVGLNCALLWQGFIDEQLELNQKALNINVLSDTSGKDAGCIYYLPDVMGFEYWSKSGSVTLKSVGETLQ